LFNHLDGYPGRAVIESRWPSATSGDGRHLWLTTTGGVVRFDTQAIARNLVAPVPSITALATEAGVYSATGPVRLPPGTHQFRIEFTAPSLRKPTQVRFEYRLDGIDESWQAAGTRRALNYTNLGPGDYTFHVRAINEDGVRSQVEAILPVTIVPIFVQTIWCKLLVAAALALLLGGAYRYRIRYFTRRLNEQMQVKLTERERIARTLHDTFLQTVHSVLLNVDAVAATLPVGDAARRRLETVLDQASTALGEGREQLQELRSDHALGLEAALEKSIDALQLVNGGITIALRVTGTPPDVPSATIDEINYIAREAVRNACTHADADQVRVTLVYEANSMTVTVTDNGQGIGAPTPRKGPAQGHWGLVGMRERAARIGADLAIDDGAEGGTVVRLHLAALPAATG
jgi:signal transduction histidine kinase